jgi:hypothetical protein
VPPAQMRAAVLLVADCYERVLIAGADAIQRRASPAEVGVAMACAAYEAEGMFRGDLGPAYSAIRLAKRIGEISPESA